MEFGDCGSLAVSRPISTYSGQLPVEAVVISKQEDDFILFVETKKNLTNYKAYFRLTPDSKNTLGEKPIIIRDIIQITEVQKLDQILDEVEDFRLEPHYRVVSYSFSGSEQKPIHCQVVGIHQVKNGTILVSGSSFVEENGFYAYHEKKEPKFEEGQFAMATCYSLGDIKGIPRENTKTGQVFPYYTEYFGYCDDNEDKEQNYLIQSLRHLTEEELKWIENRLATKEEVDLTDATLYIRDPHVAAILLEQGNELETVKAATISKRLSSIKIAKDEDKGESDVCVLVFRLTSEEYEQLFRADGARYLWREGVELSVCHQAMIGGKFTKYPELKIKMVNPLKDGGAEVSLFALPRSKEQLKIVIDNYKEFLKGEFVLTPRFHFTTAIVKSIIEGFDEFFEDRRHMFELYAGWRATPDDVEIPNKEEPFYVNGDPLDPHQLFFMKSAAHNSGWTCAQAPPGCGKTHTTAALIAYLMDKGIDEGVCISGTTNAAVTNAADAVHQHFPAIPTIRNYSKRLEDEIEGKSKEISLAEMAENCPKYLTKEEAPRVFQTLQDYQVAKNAYQRQGYKNSKQQMFAFNRLGKKKIEVNQTFIQHYNMKIYATTVELLISQGDKFAVQLVRGTEEYADKATKRIVLDEAAQLSPVEALALYCKLPNLTHITLLGDSYQLGPHSRLPKGSMAHTLLTKGELTRMYMLPSTIKRSLNGLYRCHPRIAQTILLPIYGDKMECRIEAEKRQMALDLDLPRCSDGTPFTVFHSSATEHKGENREEAMLVARFVTNLCIEKGVSPEDILILTFHRAQQDVLRQVFTDENDKLKYNSKPLIRVETVDSFQGKEAKIVILSTAKSTVRNQQVESKLQFIADSQRATVAVSRAQHAFYIFGDIHLLSKSPFYAKILTNIVKIDGILHTRNNRPLNGKDMEKARLNISAALPVSAEFQAEAERKRKERLERTRKKNAVKFAKKLAEENEAKALANKEKKECTDVKIINMADDFDELLVFD